jgi:exonuclease SbcD
VKILHLSDLHIGKKVNGFSMIDDQKYILNKVLEIVEVEKPSVVLIAGDVYDKYLPSNEAVLLLDHFLTVLSGFGCRVMLVAGNHDSAERLSFGARLMLSGGVYIVGSYPGYIKPVILEDMHGKVFFYLLPFIKPVDVQRFFPETDIKTYTNALSVVINDMNINKAGRNILVAHQFVTGASRSESEDFSIGGADNVDATVFEDFDYVALGHLHRPQNVGKKHIRYAGSPLKYSFSEASDTKSVTLIDLQEKGQIEIRALPLVPLRDTREIKDTYLSLMSKQNYENTPTEDYLHITLTDKEEEYDVFAKLSKVYPNIMKLDYEHLQHQHLIEDEDLNIADEPLSPLELFAHFFHQQTGGKVMSEEQARVTQQLMEEIKKTTHS